ncbi:hypothetical protein TNCT_455011 [Trichonephila clavata]|uniref:Uncharacterized protein n=1 Tax=Trichonephila clavata TaxID=2740835 RepID=A0A8X6JFE8_TRICU|nr:hypothetical protein TNCT_455011 [Trichonephila clavata]
MVVMMFNRRHVHSSVYELRLLNVLGYDEVTVCRKHPVSYYHEPGSTSTDRKFSICGNLVLTSCIASCAAVPFRLLSGHLPTAHRLKMSQ